MKTNLTRRLLSLAVISALGLQASAAVLNFDPDATGAGNDCSLGTSLGGGGTWDAVTANWADSANCTTDIQWVNGSDAIFWPGTGTTITASGAFTVSNITFMSAGLSLGGASTLTLSGTPTLTAPASGIATINAPLGGTGGYNVAGTGRMKLNHFGNTITGPVSIPSGSTLELAQGGTALGGNSGDITVNGGTLQNDDNGSIGSNGSGDDLFFANGTTRNLILDAVNGGTIALGASTAGLVVWPNGGNSHINGGPLLITSSTGGLNTFQTAVTGNTFSKLIIQGPAAVKINAGTTTDDTSLGALPAVTTPDAIVVTNGGMLQFNQGITINVKRGITMGASANDTNYIGFASTSSAANINSSITGPGVVAISPPNGGYFNGSSGGLVNFNASNSWHVATIINGGILVVNDPNALPHIPLIFNPSASAAWTSSRLLVVLANTTVPSLSSGPAAGAVSTIRMQSGATFTTGDDNTSTPFAGVVSSSTGAGTFVKTGTGTLTISNKWTLSFNGGAANVIITNGTIKFGAAAAGLPSQGTTAGAGLTGIALGATLDVSSQGATLAGLVGAGNVINAGNVTLDGTNATGVATFTGNITVGNGCTHSGTGTQTLGGVDSFANFTNSAGRVNFNSQGAVATAANAKLYITGTSTVGSTFAGSLTITNPVLITSAKVLTVGSGTGNTVTFSGAISDNGGSSQVSRTTADGGIVTLSGNNTFSGGVNLTGGQLNLGSATALGTGIFTNNNAAGSFDNGSAGDLTVNNITYAQGGGLHYVGANFNMTLNNPVLSGSGGGARTISVAGHTLTLNNLSQDTVGNGFAKSGAGTLALTGTATYTGNASVSAGTLRVDGSIAASSNVTVSASGTLQGNGILPTVVVNTGATIAAGDSVGTLSVTNSLTINAGSTNVWEMTDANGAAGVGYDTINANSLIISGSFANPIRIMISSLGSPAANFPGAGSWTLLHTTNGITGFDSRYFTLDTSLFVNSLDPNKAFRLTQLGNDLVLTYADPAITTDPTNTIVQHGQNAIFNVTAVGASLTYQWQKNGGNLSDTGNIVGSSSSSLTVQSVADSDIASYDVIVFDGGSVASAAATLDIVDVPSVTIQPASHTVGLGTNTQFVISWNGSADDIAKGFTTFKWKTNGVNLANNANFQGTTTSNLTVVNPITNNAVTYTVALTNIMGNTLSSGAQLGVDIIPTISIQPTSGTITPFGGFESNNTKVVAAGGDLSYQWFQATATQTNLLAEDPLNLVGTMTAQLLITNSVTTNSGSYFVIITNYAGSITSALATISVPVDPVVASSPASRSAVTGSTTVLSALASGAPNLFYHWKKDGVNLVDDGIHVIGANSATLSLISLTTVDTASSPGYVLEVTNDFDAAFADSTAATLTVFDPIVIGSTYADGVSGGRSYTNGDVITLTAPTTGGTAPFTYQWKKGAANVGNGANIVGSTTSSLTILSAVITNGGSYSLIASNFAGAVTSAPPAVVVVNQSVLITVQPTSKKADVSGQSVTFTVTATGNPLTYQWYFNSNAISGATAASYNIPSVSSANIGNYHVVVSNLINSQKSDVVTLKIGSLFFSDDLTTDTDANWNVFTNRTDGLTAWAFDYSLHDDSSGPGIPQNPNTSTSKALQVAINYTPQTTPNAITLIPKLCNATGDYQMSFDVFMNLVGHQPGPVTAQSMTAGLGCTGANTNVATSALTGQLNNGVSISADDDEQSEPAYVMYKNANSSTGAANAGSSVFVAGNGNHTTSYYSFIGGGTSFDFPTNEANSQLDGSANQTDLVPFSAGTFGLRWHHVVLKRSGTGTATTNVTWLIDGTPMGTVTNGFFSPNGTNISLGMWANFSGGGDTNWQFSLFNNVKVESFAGAGVAPTVTTPFAGASVNAGSIATLSVAATSPTTLHYQWNKNGNTIANATNSSYSITNALEADAATYSVTVFNDSDFVDGGSGILTVVAPIITQQPTDTTATCTTAGSLSVVAAGTGLTYQWYTPDANGTAVPGATDATLTINDVEGSTPYVCVVQNFLAGTATSSAASLIATGPCTDIVYVSGPTPANSTNAQGTNFTLNVSVTGDFPTYQWYVTNSGTVALVSGATSANPSITAIPLLTPAVGAKTATNFYFAIISNSRNSVTSPVARVVITLDLNNPAPLVLTSPAKNGKYGSGTPTLPFKPYAITGTATDPAKGHIAHVRYYYINSNTPPFVPSAIYEAPLVDKNAGTTGDSIVLFNITTNPPLAGTNLIAIWPVDLAGHEGKGVTNAFFYQVQIPFTLHKVGDGTGAVSFVDKMGDKVNTSNIVYFGVGTVDKTVNMNEGETYTLSYTPDRTTNNVKNLPSVISVVTNAPGWGGPTNSIKKYTGPAITVEPTTNSVSFEFDRDRFVDMAGNYNAVLTADTNNPTLGTSRYLHLTVAKSRVATGYLMDAAHVHDAFAVHSSVDSAGHLHLQTALNSIVIDGDLAWTGSENPTGIKQFTGSVTFVNTSNAVVVADLEDKNALPTPGFATMSIPGVNNNPGGSGIATHKLLNGSVTSIYTLGDDDKHPATWPLKGSRSGNIPQWIITKTGVLFGNMNATDGLSNVIAPSLSWIRNPTPVLGYTYANLLPGGFTNSPFAAVASHYDNSVHPGLTGAFTLSLSGGGLANDTNTTLIFSGNTFTTNAPSPVTGGKVDPVSGKLTVIFLDGLPSKHKTTALGVVLQNATNGAGFFIRGATTIPTNSGSLTLTPQ